MKQKGFTLLELLTVIAIISLLANTAIAAAYTTRVKARDAKRLSDLNTISKALELYYADNSSYPMGRTKLDVCVTTTDCGAGESCVNGSCFTNQDCDSSLGNINPNCSATPAMGNWETDSAFDGLNELVIDGYIDRVPIDPVNNQYFYYLYKTCATNNQDYALRTLLESNDSTYFLHPNATEILVADTNHDGIINILDLSLVVSCDGSSPPYQVSPACISADINSDGTVDTDDNDIITELFNLTC